ncbi:MAG: PQQ-binding-like beta-propeller repeat protein, partial [Rubripirellula sp.]
SVASFTGTNRILVAGDLAWLATDGKLKCLDRSQNVQAQNVMREIQNDLKNKKITAEQAKPRLQEAQTQLKEAWQWEVESSVPFDMVKAGNAVIVGLNGSVRAYGATDGKLLWQQELAGTAHGLAITSGVLIVSTDLGHIHAFAAVQ